MVYFADFLGTVRSHRKPKKITGIKMALTETRDQVGDIEQGDRHCGAMSTVPAKWLRNSRAVALGNARSRSGPQGRVLYLPLSLISIIACSNVLCRISLSLE